MKYDQDISPEELEQIERYLRDEMSVDEAAAFKVRLQTDESLSEKAQTFRMTILGINESVLEGRLHEYHNALKKPQPSGKRVFVFSGKWTLAASILLLVCLGGWWMVWQSNENQRLYSKYYRPDPGLMTLMGSGTGNYTFEKAMVEYKNGDYDKALVAWTQMLKENPDSDTLLYFCGVASQASGDYKTAIGYLKQVSNGNASAFEKEACWYLGLAYLENGETAKAIRYLQLSDRTADAQKIINSIRH